MLLFAICIGINTSNAQTRLWNNSTDRTSDTSKLAYQNEDIKLFAQNQINEVIEYPENSSGIESGYQGIIEMGYHIARSDYGPRFALNIINGYQVNRYFSLGIGTGLRYYFDSDRPLIPAFLDMRGGLFDRNISPYVSLGIGYAFNAGNNFEGTGALINSLIGIRFIVSDKSALNIGIGYEMQKLDESFEIQLSSAPNNYATPQYANAISIHIGISF